MSFDYWQQRWQDNQIGFDRQEVNPHLVAHWATIAPDAGQSVFVPLCGKSVDLAWLAERGHQVTGVEFSEIACRRFFTERGVQPEITNVGAFVRFRRGKVEILCGDFFDLHTGHLDGARLFYDRAALIALPAESRSAYLTRLGTLMVSDGSGLLISLDYPEQAFTGPPFAVSDEEVRAAFGQQFQLQQLSEAALRTDDPLLQRGLKGARESVFSIGPNPGPGIDSG